VVNDLLAISEEPNVRIMESKALVCNVRPGRANDGNKTKRRPCSCRAVMSILAGRTLRCLRLNVFEFLRPECPRLHF
jgi:hypothetical protein